MDLATIAAVFDLIQKGLTLIPILVNAGTNIAPLIENLLHLSKSAQTGSVTDDELTAMEAQLDAIISDFDTPLT